MSGKQKDFRNTPSTQYHLLFPQESVLDTEEINAIVFTLAENVDTCIFVTAPAVKAEKYY